MKIIIVMQYISSRYLSRFFDCLAHPNLSAALVLLTPNTPLIHNSFTKTHKGDFGSAAKMGISTMVNDTLLNFGKRYKDNLRVIFDQWPKLHLGLDALSNQKILKGIY